MKNFRLKKEAVQFFHKDLATSICEFDFWKKKGVDINALEEVEEMYIKYGHKTSENSSSLSGWDEKGTHFHFTIYFPSTKWMEHDKFVNGKITRELMNEIQSEINDFYVRFNNNELNEGIE